VCGLPAADHCASRWQRGGSVALKTYKDMLSGFVSVFTQLCSRTCCGRWRCSDVDVQGEVCDACSVLSGTIVQAWNRLKPGVHFETPCSGGNFVAAVFPCAVSG
jgi:hypothetical protein